MDASDDQVRRAIEHLRVIAEEARALSAIDLPIIRGNAARLVAVSSHLLGALDPAAPREHPGTWLEGT